MTSPAEEIEVSKKIEEHDKYHKINEQNKTKEQKRNTNLPPLLNARTLPIYLEVKLNVSGKILLPF